jgi:hypothetical protein
MKPEQPRAAGELVLACRPKFIELSTEGTGVSLGRKKRLR